MSKPGSVPAMASIERAVQALQQGDGDARVSVPVVIEAGALLRRHVRAAFDIARVNGAEVELYERRGLLTSGFSARLQGTPRQILPALQEVVRLSCAATPTG